MGRLTWPSGAPNARDPEWIEAARRNIINRTVAASREVDNGVTFPFGENQSRHHLKLATDLLRGYLTATIALVGYYVNHTVRPSDPKKIPQVDNPDWTLETILAYIGCDTLPDPQHNVLDNYLVLLRIKQILDLLRWIRLDPDDEDSSFHLPKILSWRTYSYSCESRASFNTRKRITPPDQTVTRCLGWEYRNTEYARHTNENGEWVVDVNRVLSEDSGIRCPPCVAASGDHAPCDWNGDDRGSLWCPEQVSSSYGASNLKTGVVWHREPSSGAVWELEGVKYGGRYVRLTGSNGGSGTTGSVTMSRPAVRLTMIPDGYRLTIFLYDSDGNRINLGTFLRDELATEPVELPNPFPEFEAIELPDNPPQWQSSTISRSQSVTVVPVWEYLGVHSVSVQHWRFFNFNGKTLLRDILNDRELGAMWLPSENMTVI